MSKLSRLREWLKKAGSCPLCGAGRLAMDEFEAEAYGFSAEAFYECGARIQIHPSSASQLQAAEGCPQALVQKCDQVEQDIEEEEQEQEQDEEEGVL
ncbi:MAG: hypothetical protein AB1592_11350 [Pseudomonadota bacterium]